MNDTPTSPDSTSHSTGAPAPASAQVATPSQAGSRLSRLPSTRVLYGVSALLAILLAGQWWTSHRQIRELRSEVASRLQVGDASNAETKVLVRSVQDATRDLQGKVSVLESKQSEAQSQQLALEQLYQELAKSRDDWALAEIEQVLSTASQQLQLAGNVQGALIALQNADSRLASSEKPQFILIRRAIANDQERLKSLPMVDVTGIALRLDSLIAQVDSMPLLSDEKPVKTASPPRTSRRASSAPSAGSKAGNAQGNASNDWLARLEDNWHSWTSEMWTEMQQLIRIRKVDSADALLLSPTQVYYVRENLKLRLMNARLGLLSRNESAFRSDLIAAQDAITRYFDTRAKQTQVAMAIMKQVQNSNLAIQMPTLAESLNAVRNYKAKP